MPPDTVAAQQNGTETNAAESKAAASDAAAKAQPAPTAQTVDVSALVTDLARAQQGMKGLRSQYEETRRKADAVEKAIGALKAGGDPDAILTAAEAAGLDTKAIENYLTALAAKKDTPAERAQRDFEKRLKSIEERDRALRAREEEQETQATIAELSASLAEEIRAKAKELPMLSKVPEDAARDLVSRAALWRIDRMAAGEEPTFDDFTAKINELAIEDESEYIGGVVDAISMMDREAAHQNKPLVEALAKIGFAPKNEPAGRKDNPAAASAQPRILTDQVAGERGTEQGDSSFAPRLSRARALEAELARRS